jgi:fucose permease
MTSSTPLATTSARPHSPLVLDKQTDLPISSSSDTTPSEAQEPLTASEKTFDHQDKGDAAVQDDPEALKAQDGQHAPRSRLKIVLIMLSLCMSVLLVAMDITIVTTALPTIAEKFNSASGYTWVGSAYLIATAAAAPIWGKVSDIFGRKPCLLICNFIFFIGSLLAGVSVNMNMLIASRVIQGIGGGGLIVLVNIAISDLFAMRERGAYFGIIGGVWALASSLGPVVGGAFTQKVSWR